MYLVVEANILILHFKVVRWTVYALGILESFWRGAVIHAVHLFSILMKRLISKGFLFRVLGETAIALEGLMCACKIAGPTF